MPNAFKTVTDLESVASPPDYWFSLEGAEPFLFTVHVLRNCSF